ncbi:unnamed protein product [Symbiodinium necroappetens]|uniref:Right handed beta helix domain-containing protein n=1 Tax=Symbiodinium necroappetens TaxID=1628268 RepID=A0A812WX95_9DINO|nr:unnamed protein product [Symbiodinium necroappetens]
MGEQELEGINVSGKMTVIAANASFVGCRNRMQDGKGGALFIQRDFIVSNSSVKFENCRASEGGGLYTDGSFSQAEESTVTFENCTAGETQQDTARPCSDGGGARVSKNFTQGRNSSASFRSCSASEDGCLYAGGSFSQEAEGTVSFENCTASGFSGGGACVRENFRQGPKSSAIFRDCSSQSGGLGLRVWGLRAPQIPGFKGDFGVGLQQLRNMLEPLPACFGVCRVHQGDGGGLYTGGSFSLEAESSVTFENCTASGASVASGSPLGERVGELKASLFRAAGSSG